MGRPLKSERVTVYATGWWQTAIERMGRRSVPRQVPRFTVFQPRSLHVILHAFFFSPLAYEITCGSFYLWQDKNGITFKGRVASFLKAASVNSIVRLSFYRFYLIAIRRVNEKQQFSIRVNDILMFPILLYLHTGLSSDLTNWQVSAYPLARCQSCNT